MRKALGLALAGGLAIVTAGTAIGGGHSSPEASAVSARQAHMQLYQFNIGALAGMARGTVEYDATAATAAASNIAALSMLDQMAYWIPNTAQGQVDGSRAKAEMWDNIPDVIAKSQSFAAAAAALAETAGNGVEALQAGMGPMGGGCNDCHKAYRGPRN